MRLSERIREVASDVNGQRKPEDLLSACETHKLPGFLLLPGMRLLPAPTKMGSGSPIILSNAREDWPHDVGLCSPDWDHAGTAGLALHLLGPRAYTVPLMSKGAFVGYDCYVWNEGRGKFEHKGSGNTRGRSVADAAHHLGEWPGGKEMSETKQ